MSSEPRTDLPLCLSFSGSGFLATYQLGVVQSLLDNAPWVLRQAPRVYGASAGALVAAAVVCGSNIGHLREEILTFTRGHALGLPSFSLIEHALRRTLPENAHVLACGRLHVSMTRIPDGHNVLVSEFHSTEDLIEALLCSCFVPVFCGMIPPRYKGVYYVDGGLTNIQPVQDCPTLTVSPFAGKVDICPSDKSTIFCDLIINHMSVHASMPNFLRLTNALFPRDWKALNKAFYNGYQDTLFFLQQSRSVRVYPDWVTQLERVQMEDWLLPELDVTPAERQDVQAEELGLESPLQIVMEEKSLVQRGTWSPLDPDSNRSPTGQALEVLICNIAAYLGMLSVLTVYLPPRTIPYLLLPLTVLTWAITTFINRVEPCVLYAFQVTYWLCQHLKQIMWFVLSIMVSSTCKGVQHRLPTLFYIWAKYLVSPGGTQEGQVSCGMKRQMTMSPSFSHNPSISQTVVNLHTLLFTLEMKRRKRESRQDVP